MKKFGALLQHPTLHLAAIALSVVGVVGAYMGVSTLDVRHSLYFQGTTTLQSGGSHALRAIV